MDDECDGDLMRDVDFGAVKSHGHTFRVPPSPTKSKRKSSAAASLSSFLGLHGGASSSPPPPPTCCSTSVEEGDASTITSGKLETKSLPPRPSQSSPMRRRSDLDQGRSLSPKSCHKELQQGAHRSAPLRGRKPPCSPKVVRRSFCGTPTIVVNRAESPLLLPGRVETTTGTQELKSWSFHESAPCCSLLEESDNEEDEENWRSVQLETRSLSPVPPTLATTMRRPKHYSRTSSAPTATTVPATEGEGKQRGQRPSLNTPPRSPNCSRRSVVATVSPNRNSLRTDSFPRDLPFEFEDDGLDDSMDNNKSQISIPWKQQPSVGGTATTGTMSATSSITSQSNRSSPRRSSSRRRSSSLGEGEGLGSPTTMLSPSSKTSSSSATPSAERKNVYVVSEAASMSLSQPLPFDPDLHRSAPCLSMDTQPTTTTKECITTTNDKDNSNVAESKSRRRRSRSSSRGRKSRTSISSSKKDDGRTRSSSRNRRQRKHNHHRTSSLLSASPISSSKTTASDKVEASVKVLSQSDHKIAATGGYNESKRGRKKTSATGHGRSRSSKHKSSKRNEHNGTSGGGETSRRSRSVERARSRNDDTLTTKKKTKNKSTATTKKKDKKHHHHRSDEKRGSSLSPSSSNAAYRRQRSVIDLDLLSELLIVSLEASQQQSTAEREETEINEFHNSMPNLTKNNKAVEASPRRKRSTLMADGKARVSSKGKQNEPTKVGSCQCSFCNIEMSSTVCSVCSMRKGIVAKEEDSNDDPSKIPQWMARRLYKSLEAKQYEESVPKSDVTGKPSIQLLAEEAMNAAPPTTTLVEQETFSDLAKRPTHKRFSLNQREQEGLLTEEATTPPVTMLAEQESFTDLVKRLEHMSAMTKLEAQASLRDLGKSSDHHLVDMTDEKFCKEAPFWFK